MYQKYILPAGKARAYQNGRCISIFEAKKILAVNHLRQNLKNVTDIEDVRNFLEDLMNVLHLTETK